tara:strand:+ start:611 stop:1009 length:399 start_codon:yes stop_codon:yes gene_type:complete
MKITKTKLRQIIAEELASIKKEGRYSKNPSWTKTGYELAQQDPDHEGEASDARMSPGESLGQMIGDWIEGKVKFIVNASGGDFQEADLEVIEEEVYQISMIVRDAILKIADKVHPEEFDDDPDEDYALRMGL